MSNTTNSPGALYAITPPERHAELAKLLRRYTMLRLRLLQTKRVKKALEECTPMPPWPYEDQCPFVPVREAEADAQMTALMNRIADISVAHLNDDIDPINTQEMYVRAAASAISEDGRELITSTIAKVVGSGSSSSSSNAAAPDPPISTGRRAKLSTSDATSTMPMAATPTAAAATTC